MSNSLYSFGMHENHTDVREREFLKNADAGEAKGKVTEAVKDAKR